MQYQYLKERGALHEVDLAQAGSLSAASAATSGPTNQLLAGPISAAVVELIPESVARENRIMPLAFDGETIICAAVNPESIGLADKLRFLLAKNVRLVAASEEAIIRAIHRHYGLTRTESVDSMLQEFTDTAIDATPTTTPHRAKRNIRWRGPALGRSLGQEIVEFKKGLKGPDEDLDDEGERRPGLDRTRRLGGSGMFFYIVEEGQRVLVRHPDGTIQIIAGPKRVWWGRKVFTRMEHYLAHPGEFLIVRYRDGRQDHLPGPTEVWRDPRVHQEITRQDALQLAAKEAVVVYSRREGADGIARRIEYGPGLFIPRPGEWLHTFSWHASRGGSKGVEKVPNGLVFQKLWLMPDQMYHDVPDVRTADDAVLTIRLMLFFELVDIERMLDATHDPIGDFVNATTSDVVDFTGKYDFEAFKRHTDQLNELATYRQLTNRAAQCGYRINKVVYRGYGAPESLQQMHNQAIEARTRLQLERATNQQAQELEDYKLDCQIARAVKRRGEQAAEVEHDLDMARKRREAELRNQEAQRAMLREQERLEAEQQLAMRRRQDEQQREHLAALRSLDVNLTAFLTQARADRVIELRGANGTHVHLDQITGERDQNRNS
jgi:hypothetical protein